MKRILVIDDELETRTVIELILSENNFVVETLSRSQYLTYSIEFFKPDLILLDVGLEGADGRELCNTLKTSPKTAHIPVILFSGYPNLSEHLHGCQPDAIIEKPVDLVKLLEVIKQTLHEV